jgi:serine/threonine protein kinase
MVVEYLSGGDLCEHLTALSKDHTGALDLFFQVVEGVAHLHKHWFVHNDIKADNVLLSSDGIPKLCDFGLACKIGQPLSGCGTSLYMAPELFGQDGKKVGVLASPLHDVWSLGVLLFVMLTDEFPWQLSAQQDRSLTAMQGNKSGAAVGLSQYEHLVCSSSDQRCS